MPAPTPPLQSQRFDEAHGGPRNTGLVENLAGMGIDMLLGNKPGPSDRFKFHMGGGGETTPFGGYLNGALDPAALRQLEAIRSNRLQQGIGTLAANPGVLGDL